ncbi:unnamed protein product [Pedinophyceae sp. YPF-701]|nr:unnamed protein product [Pedinophyceae sp. YPF-701]
MPKDAPRIWEAHLGMMGSGELESASTNSAQQQSYAQLGRLKESLKSGQGSRRKPASKGGAGSRGRENEALQLQIEELLEERADLLQQLEVSRIQRGNRERDLQSALGFKDAETRSLKARVRELEMLVRQRKATLGVEACRDVCAKLVWLAHHWKLAHRIGVLPSIAENRALFWEAKSPPDSVLLQLANITGRISPRGAVSPGPATPTGARTPARARTPSPSRRDLGTDAVSVRGAPPQPARSVSGNVSDPSRAENDSGAAGLQPHPIQLPSDTPPDDPASLASWVVPGRFTEAEVVEVDRGMREAAELHLVDLVMIELSDREHLGRPVPQGVTTGAGMEMHPRWLVNHTEIGEEQARQACFLQAWLVLQWSAAAELPMPGLGEEARRRADHWRARMSEESQARDLVAAWRDLQDLQLMGLDLHLWRARVSATR